MHYLFIYLFIYLFVCLFVCFCLLLQPLALGSHLRRCLQLPVNPLHAALAAEQQIKRAQRQKQKAAAAAASAAAAAAAALSRQALSSRIPFYSSSTAFP